MKKLILVGILASGAVSAQECNVANAQNAWDNVRIDVPSQMEVVGPGLEGTSCKLLVNASEFNLDRARVQDRSADCEYSFRARFVFNADEVTVAGSLGGGAMRRTERNKIFNAQCIDNQHTDPLNPACDGIGVIQLRMQGDDRIAGTPDFPGENILFSFVSDANQPDLRRRFKVLIQPGLNTVELEWNRASANGISDGVFRGWFNNTTLTSPDVEFTDLNNHGYCIDQVNLGLIKATQIWSEFYEGLNLEFDEYESRRQTPIGLN